MIHRGNALHVLGTFPSDSIDCVITSPPYWGLRDYGIDGQLGNEETIGEYVSNMRDIFTQVYRVLKPEGTLWLNLGDTYANDRASGSQGKNGERADRRFTPLVRPHIGLPRKNLCGIPWRVAFALQDSGWILRNEIIWQKPNAMPHSVKDRFTVDHEQVFFFAKSERYFFNQLREPHQPQSIKRAARAQHSKGMPYAMQEDTEYKGYDDLEGKLKRGELRKKVHPDGRNKRTVWNISTQAFRGAHFATFPQKLVEPCIEAGCPKGGIVLDPFFGAGTVGVVAKRMMRSYVGIELNPEYALIAAERISEIQLPML